MILTPGIHTIGMAEYLQLPALSSGLCHTLLGYSPFHAKYAQDNPSDESSKAADIGTLVHACLLEGGTDNCRVFDPANFPNAKGGGVATGWTNKAIRDARDEARANGEIPILFDDFKAVQSAIAAAKNFIAGSELAGVFDSGAPEETLVWQEGGVLCKARPDWLSADCSLMIHVKTTQGSANPNAWIRTQLTPCGYDLALAFYERGLSEVAQVDIIKSVFLVIEQEPPHGCSLVGLDPASHDLASRKAERAIRLWAECQRTGRYPCYPSRICYAEPKPWEMAQEEEREMSQPFTEKELEGGIPL